MGNWVTVQDVELEWGRGEIPAEQQDHVNVLIDKAERLVVEAVPDWGDRIEAGTLTAQAIGDVVSSMVLRVLRNPSGYRSETAGDYTYQLDSAVAAGRLFLSKDERRRLRGRVGSGGAFSIRTNALTYGEIIAAETP
jgi:hypothetical protein